MTEAAIHPIGLVKRGAKGRLRVLPIHKYLPLALIYFFLNSTGLPTGLFVTTLLSPLFAVWLYCKGLRWTTTKFVICLSPFLIMHFVLGVESPYYYVRSLALLWTAYITVFTFCWALLKTVTLERLFEQLISINFAAFVIAIFLLPTPARDLVWDNEEGVIGASHVYRLRLLNSEPSVYSSLMVPLLVFVTLRLIVKPNRRNLIYVLMVTLPFLFCQSFEGISGVSAGIAVAMLVTFRHLFRRRNSLFLVIALVSVFALLLLIPNPISARFVQVISGNDSSAHSRTIYSFLAAYTVAAAKSLWWGAGLGQGKIIDVSSIGNGFTVGIIPNAVAGTFAEFGIIGMSVRFTVEIVLFFRTRAYRNPFRLAMFIAAFGFQLSGSYLDNVQEGLMWCFAFGPFFPDLNRKLVKES